MSNKPVIVIDPGHGGKEKIGGSSPNNAVGANGLLEKNLTLDMANRVAATLAAQTSVFLTRPGDTNLGLSDRAKFARDKNADVFLSLHFNGFSDTAVDGTEVWVAKKANQRSRDLARTLLGKVAGATKLRDRGIREGDLGVLLPERHASGTSACLLETSFLSNPAQAKQLESDAYRQAIANSICEGLRQFLSLGSTAQSFFYVSDDMYYSSGLAAPTQDEIAVELGYASHADYLSKEVKPAKLFGLTVENGLRDDFYKKLQQGEKEAAKLIHPDGSPVSASQWGIKGIRGQMKRTGRSWHPWGAAIDVDYSLNPYIMHESGETAMDALVAPIYRRIALFMLKRDSVIPKSGAKDAIRDIS
ncbi:MAG: N-acetylmuramoyl-L-alanine amidase, partial [Saprospiraceae bacterium]|nr:N-acetylmuramoyl-L-alanine amidase [Pyrinomonadaceae bacterium]